MMSVLLSILFLLYGLFSFAQSDATFSVAKKKKVFIECKYDTLAGDKYYYFKVYGASTKELIPGKFAGGEVWLNDTAVCIHTYNSTSSPKKHLLELFLRKDNSAVFSRGFTIMPAANNKTYLAPVPNVNTEPDVVFSSEFYNEGTRTSSKDSLLSKVNKLLVALTPTSVSHSKITTNLKMVIICSGESRSYMTTELKTSPEMITAINAMYKDCRLVITMSFHSFNDPPEDRQMGPYRFDIR